MIGCFHSVDFSLYTLYGVSIEGKQEPMVLLQAAELSHAQSSMYLIPVMDVRRLHRTLFSPSRSLTSSFKRVLTRLPPTTSPMPIGFYWTPFDVISMWLWICVLMMATMSDAHIQKERCRTVLRNTEPFVSQILVVCYMIILRRKRSYWMLSSNWSNKKTKQEL